MKVTHLITTACQEVWPENKDQTVLFLGEWCKIYNEKEIWQQFDSKTAPYHWDDREKLHTDYKTIQATCEKTLVALTTQLNIMHQVNYSLRYWRILIGPWLEHFIQMLFDRWFMLRQTFDNNEKYSCSLIRRDSLPIVSNDMSEFTKLFVEDDWNEVIYSQLIQLFWKDRVEITWVKVKNKKKSKKTLNKSIKGIIKRAVSFSNKTFSKDDSYFFISSYLPLKEELKLQVQLGQMPCIWVNSSAPVIKCDNIQRQWKVDIKPVNDFEKAIQSMVPLHIPVVYLEGYRALDLATEELPWPKRPKAIFTSNSYSENDMFKAWTAKKTEFGVPLIIGQHGGGYGVSLFLSTEEHQIKIANKWLSWGWGDPNKDNIVPIGILITEENNVKYNPGGYALMVESITPRYSYRLYSNPIASQWQDYFSDQKLFLSKLSNSIKDKTVLRLGTIDYDWNQVNRWQDAMPGISIDSGAQDIKKLIQNSRICISTYNSTTYLESLVWNVPTIIFWNPKHWELSEQAQSYFDMLESVGIFHATPQSAAQQMTKVWNDVEDWWQSREVQEAREKFIDQYAVTSDDKLDLLKGTLVEAANEANGKIQI